MPNTRIVLALELEEPLRLTVDREQAEDDGSWSVAERVIAPAEVALKLAEAVRAQEDLGEPPDALGVWWTPDGAIDEMRTKHKTSRVVAPDEARRLLIAGDSSPNDVDRELAALELEAEDGVQLVEEGFYCPHQYPLLSAALEEAVQASGLSQGGARR